MNNEPTIEQMNEAIAYFMGYYYQASKFYPKSGERGKWFKEAKYHSSWDWLMLVVIKIKTDPSSCIRAECGGIPDSVMPYINAMREMNHWLIRPDIEKCHKGVYQFIQWYNKQQSNEQPK